MPLHHRHNAPEIGFVFFDACARSMMSSCHHRAYEAAAGMTRPLPMPETISAARSNRRRASSSIRSRAQATERGKSNPRRAVRSLGRCPCARLSRPPVASQRERTLQPQARLLGRYRDVRAYPARRSALDSRAVHADGLHAFPACYRFAEILADSMMNIRFFRRGNIFNGSTRHP